MHSYYGLLGCWVDGFKRLAINTFDEFIVNEAGIEDGWSARRSLRGRWGGWTPGALIDEVLEKQYEGYLQSSRLFILTSMRSLKCF